MSLARALIEEYGPPASTLSDNGSVYTSPFTGGRHALEYILPILGIRQKNGSPCSPADDRAEQDPLAQPKQSARPMAKRPKLGPMSRDM